MLFIKTKTIDTSYTQAYRAYDFGYFLTHPNMLQV